MRIKKIFTIAFLLFSLQSFGQFGVMVGPSALRPFGAQKTFFGAHVGGEYSVDDESSYFGRVTVYGNAKDEREQYAQLDPLNSLLTLPSSTNFTTRTNYTVISGGARYYLGDGYETGLSVYGGSVLTIVFNSVKADFDEFDETKYRVSDLQDQKGSAFGFGAGLQGGVKYGVVGLGTVYFDLGLDYMFAYQASNNLSSTSPYLSNVLFQFNLGFRKDIGGF